MTLLRRDNNVRAERIVRRLLQESRVLIETEEVSRGLWTTRAFPAQVHWHSEVFLINTHLFFILQVDSAGEEGRLLALIWDLSIGEFGYPSKSWNQSLRIPGDKCWGNQNLYSTAGGGGGSVSGLTPNLFKIQLYFADLCDQTLRSVTFSA